jgi:multidrug efflux pump subunit AcrB
MLASVIRFFASRHLLVNLVTAAVFAGGAFVWWQTPKEEMPNVVFNWVRVSASYPGAPAADIERLITVPLEEAARGVDGVRNVDSTSSVGYCRLGVELEADADIEATVMELRNAVLDARLPEDMEDDPHVRVFKTSRKAIIDIGVYLDGRRLLDFSSRQRLQQVTRSLENQLLVKRAVHSVNRRGYQREEIEVRVRPSDLYRYKISFDAVRRAIRNNHFRQPAGVLDDGKESKVTIGAELDDPALLKALVVQGGFEGKGVRLDRLAGVARQHEESKSIRKINGHEGIMLNVVKSADAGILEALESVHEVLERFERNNLAGTRFKVVLLDDESTDLRNRLTIITINGAIGFVLILVILFIFLDFRSGLWVGVGIPFTFCVSMIVLSSLGFTINNMTLAGVIIVMGMVVDDAIIVAENVHRVQGRALGVMSGAVEGTARVVAPITAAVLTTCAAFLPLYFMESRWAQLNWVIPGVVSVMLASSLFESVFILPSHLTLNIDRLAELVRWRPKWWRSRTGNGRDGRDWFERYEEKYRSLLKRLLPRRRRVFLVFGGVFAAVAALYTFQFKFVMFPREETREISIHGEVREGALKHETARLVEEIEDLLTPYVGKEVVGWRTDIARGRRDSAGLENNFRIVVEIVPKEKRSRSAGALIAEWEEAVKDSKTFRKLRFAKSRWGQSSGSPIEVIVRGNDDAARDRAARKVLAALEANPHLKTAEIERDMRVPEYGISLKRDLLKRLSIDPPTVAATFRAALQGGLLYEIIGGDEEVKVRFTADRESQNSIDNLLKVPVANQRGYLVPLGDLVDVKKADSSSSITRNEGRRLTRVYADLADGGAMTPEEVAVSLEDEVFPALLRTEQSLSFDFGGEIRETRESRGDLRNAVLGVLVLIFVILSVLFGSLVKPLMVMVAIPFGAVGVIIAFFMHGILEVGLFAAIGTIGLAGVVVNDAIVMVFRIGEWLRSGRRRHDSVPVIAGAAGTRLKAVVLTTLTTSAALLPTAYGFAGYDAMLAQMMLAMAWGLIFGTAISLVLVPCLYAELSSAKWFQEPT